MGLSGAKKKNKISRDPNNNGWASSTDRFGHRILTAQGWTPGSYLGAKDAAHSEHFTAANVSHIRVLLKDDNLGLGAKRGAKAETFGLSTLQGIFGRLNGKSDAELIKEEKVNRDSELVQYQSQRWGHVQFVSGGFLVGDSIQRLRTEKGTTASDLEKTEPKIESCGAKTSKKRKRDGVPSSEFTTTQRLAEQSLADGNRPPIPSAAGDNPDQESAAATDEEKVSLRRRKDKEEKRKRKAERQHRRLERQARRDARALKKQKHHLAEEEEKSTGNGTSNAPPNPAVAEVQTTASTVGAPFGRHAVRSRYIRQKRMAMADAKALNEILMIKAQG